MEIRKRNVQIIVWVTEKERALIDGYIIAIDLQEVKAHTAQLQKIGVNVNQIARHINEKGVFTPMIWTS